MKEHIVTVVMKSCGRNEEDSLHIPGRQERRNWSEKQKERPSDTDLLGRK